MCGHLTEQQDQESKTEDPTEKRLTDAREKGNIPVARDMTLMGSMGGILCAILMLGPYAMSTISNSLKAVLGTAGVLRLDDREAAVAIMVSLLLELIMPVLLIMLLVSGGSILATVLQNTPTLAGQRLQPNLTRVSLIAGWQRLFGRAGQIEFIKSSLKLLGVMTILWFLFEKTLPVFVSAMGLDPIYIPEMLRVEARHIIMSVFCFAAALAIGDLVWARHRWHQELRMTFQEVRDEMKQAEGDPLLKARIRSIWRQRASKRMLEKVPSASVVITNPTHYAIALRYVREDGGAPTVVAKGIDYMAVKIREKADASNIPMIENKPLARGLYEQVDLDEQIPPEFYHAVAEIILYLNRTGRLQARTQLN